MKILRLLALTGLMFQPLFVYADVPPACSDFTTGMIADFNDDGRVNRKDIAILAEYMGISFNLAKRMVENQEKVSKLNTRNDRKVAELKTRNARKVARAEAKDRSVSYINRLNTRNQKKLDKLIARNAWKVDKLMARIDKFNARHSLQDKNLADISQAILNDGSYSCVVDDNNTDKNTDSDPVNI